MTELNPILTDAVEEDRADRRGDGPSEEEIVERTAFSSGGADRNNPRNNYFPLNRLSLKVGDHVIVVASPAKDPASHELATIAEVRRAADAGGLKRLKDTGGERRSRNV
jgi:hypothetical protein